MKKRHFLLSLLALGGLNCYLAANNAIIGWLVVFTFTGALIVAQAEYVLTNKFERNEKRTDR